MATNAVENNFFALTSEKVAIANAIASSNVGELATVAGISIVAAQAIIEARKHGANDATINNMVSTAQAGGAMPPDDGDDNNRKNRQKITEKEAREQAKKLGYQETKQTTSHGAKIYKNGRDYITRDMYRHSNGFWKRANSPENLESKTTRTGTYNRDLTIKIGD